MGKITLMAINNFKPFAIGAGANVTSQEDWEALESLSTGFQSGKAASAQVNKAIRQATTISAVVGQFIADNSSSDALDDGNVAMLLTSLQDALNNNLPAASTTVTGITRLSSATNSNDETMAATPKAVKEISDRVSALNVKTVNYHGPDDVGNVQLTSADISLGNVGNFMAVQQGGVSNQATNKLYIGWGTDGKLRLSVDNTDQGLIYTTNSPPPYPVTSVNGLTGAVALNDTFSTDGSSMYWDSVLSSLRIQIGVFSIGAGSGASGTVSFPTAFPNWCLFAVPVPDSSVASSAATEQIGVGGRTNTTVTFTKGVGDPDPRGGKYLAIGY